MLWPPARLIHICWLKKMGMLKSLSFLRTWSKSIWNWKLKLKSYIHHSCHAVSATEQTSEIDWAGWVVDINWNRENVSRVQGEEFRDILETECLGNNDILDRNIHSIFVMRTPGHLGLHQQRFQRYMQKEKQGNLSLTATTDRKNQTHFF